MSCDLFISYARKDDVQGFVSALHDALEADYQTLAAQPIEAFFDIHDIVLFDDWREKILAHLRSSRLFLACLSPNYFTSDPCRWEWAEWIKHELARGHYGNGIATIYFVEPRTLTPTEKAEAVRWMEDLKRRHGIVFGPWFPEGRNALQRADARERLRQVTEHVRLKLDQLDLARDIPGNLDAANPGFVGRLSELAQLHQKVRLGPVGVTTAVQGLGGMGKTALALHYAYAYAREYPGGRWQLRCAGQHDLATVLTQINETLQLTWTEPEQRDTRLQAQRVLSECKSKGHTLLLLDNVDSPALLSAAQTSSLLKGDWLHTLFTTHLPESDFPGLPASSEFLTLDRLDPLDALQLLRQHQPDQTFPSPEEESAAAEIIEALGGLTLAIETAAIYLGQHATQIKPSAYLQRLRKDLLQYHDDKAKQVEGAIRHGHAEVTATLRPTLETLPPAARTILALAAMSAPDAVVLPWLREVAGKHHPELLTEPEVGELDPWTEIITRLIGLRLLRPTEEPRVLTMHRVLQDVVLRCHTKPLEELELQFRTNASLRATFLWMGWVEHQNRWEVLPLAATTEHWIPKLDGTGSGLAGQMMEPLKELMHFGKAESLLVAALCKLLPVNSEPQSSALTLLGRISELPERPEVAALLNNLAALYQSLSRTMEAEQLLLRALNIGENCFGKAHPRVAATLGNLVQLLISTNRVIDAQPLMLRAFEIEKENFAPSHPRLAIALDNLAQVFQALNRPREAEPLMRQALVIDEECFGVNHPTVATALNNLATLLQVLGQRSEAESLLRRALAIDEACFGLNHHRVAVRLNNLARLLQDTNRATDAEPLLLRAVAIEEACFGQDHTELVSVLQNLASLYFFGNREEDAERLIRRVLLILLRSSAENGHPHPDLRTAVPNYIGLLRKCKGDAAIQPALHSLQKASGLNEVTFRGHIAQAFDG